MELERRGPVSCCCRASMREPLVTTRGAGVVNALVPRRLAPLRNGCMVDMVNKQECEKELKRKRREDPMKSRWKSERYRESHVLIGYSRGVTESHFSSEYNMSMAILQKRHAEYATRLTID